MRCNGGIALKKYALVLESGEVRQVIVPASTGEYVDGGTVDGCLIVELPDDCNTADVLTSWVYVDSGWIVADKKPSALHDWDSVANCWSLNTSRLLRSIRASRNIKLANCDWTQMPDAPLSDSKKAEWATYRQALRDLPASVENITSLDAVVWPTKPT